MLIQIFYFVTIIPDYIQNFNPVDFQSFVRPIKLQVKKPVISLPTLQNVTRSTAVTLYEAKYKFSWKIGWQEMKKIPCKPVRHVESFFSLSFIVWFTLSLELELSVTGQWSKKNLKHRKLYTDSKKKQINISYGSAFMI